VKEGDGLIVAVAVRVDSATFGNGFMGSSLIASAVGVDSALSKLHPVKNIAAQTITPDIKIIFFISDSSTLVLPK
jgi:hypothetical protein